MRTERLNQSARPNDCGAKQTWRRVADPQFSRKIVQSGVVARSSKTFSDLVAEKPSTRFEFKSNLHGRRRYARSMPGEMWRVARRTSDFRRFIFHLFSN